MKKAVSYFLISLLVLAGSFIGVSAKNNSEQYFDKGALLMKKELSRFSYYKSLGEPDSRSTSEVWGADGMEHQDWFWSKSGVKLNMVRYDSKYNKCKVFSDNSCIFSAEFPSWSDFKTLKGIGAGNTKDEVLAAYKNEIEKDVVWGDDSIVAGSIYSGIIFSFKDNRVINIFIGAAAE